jgi:WD40 repeat protein
MYPTCNHWRIWLALAVFSSPFAIAFPSSSSAQSMQSTKSESQSKPDKVSYESVQPILRKHCVSCHNDDQPRGDLSLVSFDKIAAGSSSGHVLSPGKPEESSLFLVTSHLENPKMPPNKPRIPQRELDLLEKWIRTGLVDEMSPNDGPHSNEGPTSDEGQPKGMMPPGLEDVSPFPQSSPVHTAASHPTEPLVAIPGVKQVLIVDALSRHVSKAIPVADSTVSYLAFSPLGDVLYVGTGVPSERGHVARWDLLTQKWMEPIGQGPDTPMCLAVSPDGKRLAVGTTTKRVHVYDTQSGRELFSHEKHTDWIISLRWSPDGMLLASGDRFGAIQIWDAMGGKPFASLRSHTGSIVGMLWTAEGNHLVSAAWDGRICVWDMHEQKEIASWKAHDQGVLGIVSTDHSGSVSKQGGWLSFGRDGKLLSWPNSLLADHAPPKPFREMLVRNEMTQLVSLAQKQGENRHDKSPSSQSYVVCDSHGKAHVLDWIGSKQVLLEGAELALPVRQERWVYHVRRPLPPSRVSVSAISESGTTDLKKRELAQDDSIRVNLEKALESSRNALESIQLSKNRAEEMSKELEEASRILQQSIAIQEAQLKAWKSN